MTTASHVDISRALTINGWMSPRELAWLAFQAKKHNLIVEFGCYHGRSTRALADNNDGKIWAVDPRVPDYYHEDGRLFGIKFDVLPSFTENLHGHIQSGHVIPVREFSYNFSLPYEVDMVFIDGDHRYDTVVKDIKKAYELLKKGGLISGHDYGHWDWPGVKKAVDELIEKVQIEDTIWWTLK